MSILKISGQKPQYEYDNHTQLSDYILAEDYCRLTKKRALVKKQTITCIGSFGAKYVLDCQRQEKHTVEDCNGIDKFQIQKARGADQAHLINENL